MAKHAHKLIKYQKKTWRCTLEGCSFFVHLGLEHVLIGKQAVCSECGDDFRIDENALKEDMPRCGFCREGFRRKEEHSKLQKALERLGVASVSELNDGQRTMLEALQLLPRTEIQEDKPVSEVLPDTTATGEPEKPRRTPEQQKAYDKIMRELGLR